MLISVLLTALPRSLPFLAPLSVNALEGYLGWIALAAALAILSKMSRDELPEANRRLGGRIPPGGGNNGLA